VSLIEDALRPVEHDRVAERCEGQPRSVSVVEIAYLVTCSQTGETLLIDAANDAEILQLIERYAPKLSLIVTSHQHQDHWLALEAVAKATGVPTAAHQLDSGALPVKPDRVLANGDTVKIGQLSFKVIHLQGHTPGSVALALDGADEATHLFIGDCLLPGGVGKTWKRGDFTQLLTDVTSRVFDVYPDSTVVYPGHGDTTLGTATRPWARNARTWANGGSGVGDPVKATLTFRKSSR
jgi:glyoxylase-like metal-dependent hydrolase (beta-lactamase superfamily II)